MVASDHLDLVPVCEAPVREIDAHVFVYPLDGLLRSVEKELLVRVAGCAGPYLQLGAVRRVPVRDIKTHVAINDEPEDKRRPQLAGRSVARLDNDLSTVRVGGRGEARRVADDGGDGFRWASGQRPLLIRTVGTGPDLHNITVGRVAVGEIQATRLLAPPDRVPRQRPLLVRVARGALPDLQWRPICGRAPCDIQAHVIEHLQGGSGDCPVLHAAPPGGAIFDDDGRTVRVRCSGEAHLKVFGEMDILIRDECLTRSRVFGSWMAPYT